MNKVQISKNEWLKMGKMQGWLPPNQQKKEQSGLNDISVEVSVKDFFAKGVYLDWEDKQQLLRAYRKQGSEAFAQLIKSRPDQFPLLRYWEDSLLKTIYGIIEEKEKEYASTSQVNTR